mgnify:CR=1 FL=1
MEKTLGYDKTSIQSIFNYSTKLIGHSLREVVDADTIASSYLQGQGKGGLEHMIESLFFKYPINSDPGPDFSEAGLELKGTGLKELKSGEYQIKERLVCDMIDYMNVVNENFETSLFYIKSRIMLLIFYLYKKGVNKLDLKFIYTVLWRLPEKDLLIIRHDFETIVNKIKRGEAHLLSEGDTEYLGACRKGQKGDSPRQQPFSDILAPRRAFSLKPAYMRTVLSYVKEQGTPAVSNFEIETNNDELVSIDDLKNKTFEDIILKRFEDFIGQSYQNIASLKDVDLSKKPKNKFALIANAIASSEKCPNVNRSEEFLKAGLTMKTIRVSANGNIKEAMSFENIDYLEIAECDEWYDSRLYELFSNRFMFVVFKEQTPKEEDFILSDVFFWTMPETDLNGAEQYWDHIRDVVLKNKISDENWWKAKDRKKFHVRPKATKATDLAPTPQGGFAKKFCYWFNNDYVREIINNRNLENEYK